MRKLRDDFGGVRKCNGECEVSTEDAKGVMSCGTRCQVKALSGRINYDGRLEGQAVKEMRK